MRKKMNKVADEILKLGMVDQYGDPIPDDLVFLPTVDDLRDYREIWDDADIDQILDADWYEIENTLCAPWSQIGEVGIVGQSGPEEYWPNDELLGMEIYKIDSPLKRFDEDDGFYHA